MNDNGLLVRASFNFNKSSCRESPKAMDAQREGFVQGGEILQKEGSVVLDSYHDLRH